MTREEILTLDASDSSRTVQGHSGLLVSALPAHFVDKTGIDLESLDEMAAA